MKSESCRIRALRLRTLGLGALASLTLSACGGGGGISGTVPPTGPVCNSTTGVAAGYSMGTCSSATALISLGRPIDAAVTIAPGPNYSVTLPLPGGDPVPTHNLDATNISTLNTLGDVRGLYLQKDYGAGAYIAIGDFASAVDRTSGNSKFAGGALSYTNFGLWERFVSANEGYYGGWFLPRNSAAANPVLPITGSATYTGVLVGALAPVNGNPPLYGLSGAISLTTNFATSAVNGTMSGFMLSNQLLTGPVAAPINPVNLSGSISGSGFSGTMPAGGGSGAASGTFQGAFFGPSAAGGPPEVAGRFQFVTPDAQQIVGAFGARQ